MKVIQVATKILIQVGMMFVQVGMMFVQTGGMLGPSTVVGGVPIAYPVAWTRRMAFAWKRAETDGLRAVTHAHTWGCS